MSDFFNGSVAVNTAELDTKASELSDCIRLLKINFEEMYERISSTANYWQGDAAEKYRSEFNSKKTDIETSVARLLEHVTDLRVMAGVYRDAEKDNIDITEQYLEDDVIV